MERHLRLVPSGSDLLDPDDSEESPTLRDTNVVDLESERQRRRSYRYHPSAGRSWLDDLFDDEDDLDPVC